MKKSILIFSILFCSVFFTAQAKDENPQKAETGKIEVNGSSSVSITPDVLYVEIGMREYYKPLADGDSVRVTIGEIEKRVNKSLEKAGVKMDDVTITDYGNYHYPWISKAFLMSKTISAKLTSMDQLVELAEHMNIKGVISFRISKTDASDMEKYNRQGLKAALDKAREKAEFIAKNEGLELIMPIDIVEDGPIYYEEAMVTNVMLNGVAEDAAADMGAPRMMAKGATMDSMKKIVRRYNVRVIYATRIAK